MLQDLGHGKTTVRQPTPWKFAYIGGTGNQRTQGDVLTLKGLQVGDRGRIEGYLDREERQQFQRSGLAIGAEILVLSRTSSGSIVVRIGKIQIGLGAGIVDRIRVKPL
jgi:Fe2+ transport system protein FeoA